MAKFAMPISVPSSPPPPVEAKCTVCGYKRTFYTWQGEPSPGDRNVNFAKSTGLIEDYCYECGVNRAFQRV